MKTEPTTPPRQRNETNVPGPLRPSIRVAVWVMGFLSLAALLGAWWPKRAVQPLQKPSELVQDDRSDELKTKAQSSSLKTPRPARVFQEAVAGQRPHYQFQPPTQAVRQLVAELTNPLAEGGVLNAEQIAAWKKRLQCLIQQGAGGVLGIREFLASNLDFDFGEAGRQALGYTSARAAMIDALGQIGGPLAVNAMAETLQTTAEPQEIALLAKYLETVDPGLHRPMILDAARQSLAMAAEGNLPNTDAAPLFEVLQQFPDAGTVSDLERAGKQWNYYATMALAKLPNDEGIPSLIQLAQNGGNSAALTMLAQAATQSDTARAALVQEARQNKLSIFSWAMLAPILAGAELHFQGSVFDSSLSTANANDLQRTYIPATNQRWFIAPTADSLSPERVTQNAALINELLLVTSDPVAVRTLQQAQLSLTQRAGQITR